MRAISCCLTIVMFTCFAASADAGVGGLFRKPPKPKPEERVPLLLETLKSDPDDKKRTDAAEELGDYDAKAFPAIIPALVDALKSDTSTWVRRESAKALGGLRPISQAAGYALESASQNDASLIVRAAAHTSLGFYHLGGFRKANYPEGAMPMQTAEPPLATPLRTIPSIPTMNTGYGPRIPPIPMVTPMPTKPLPRPPLMPAPQQSGEPPLATMPPMTATPPMATTPPKTTSTDDGPALSPPK